MRLSRLRRTRDTRVFKTDVSTPRHEPSRLRLTAAPMNDANNGCGSNGLALQLWMKLHSALRLDRSSGRARLRTIGGFIGLHQSRLPHRRSDKAGEERVWIEGFALQFRVELDAYEPAEVRPLD